MQAPSLPPQPRQKQRRAPPGSRTALAVSPRAAPPSERQYLGRVADLPAAGTLPGLHCRAGRAVRTPADPEVDATLFSALAPCACVEEAAGLPLGAPGPALAPPLSVVRPQGSRSGLAWAADAP